MDPPLVNDSSFSGANPGPCSLSEFWPFGGGDMSASVRLRMSILGQNFGGFMENSANLDGSAEESTVTEQSRSRGGCGAGKKRRDANSEDESSKIVSRSSGNDLNNSIRKRMKTSRSSDENGGSKIETETSSGTGNKSAEQSTQLSQYPKQDFIHVIARRGQATDRHSLAERAQREKISERMKILQDLVPACNNVIGKALVLDEIINYIQSLQRQVEFLSMKLEAVNSRMNPTNERLPSKDVFDTAGMIFGPQERREYAQGWQTEWLHRQLGGNFERAT